MKVLIVEDDPTMAEMLSYNLGRQGLDVETARDGITGLSRGKAPETALVILDIMLPGMDGLAVADELRRVRPMLPILMLTASGDETTKLNGFSKGADDYLTKPFLMEELVARVKALLRRGSEPVDSPAPLILGDLELFPQDLRCVVAGSEVPLRPKEFALLKLLAERPGKVFSRVEIASRIWGFEEMIDTRTIDTHVKNLRRKIESPSAYSYLETVRGVGYRLRVRPKAT